MILKILKKVCLEAITVESKRYFCLNFSIFMESSLTDREYSFSSPLILSNL